MLTEVISENAVKSETIHCRPRHRKEEKAFRPVITACAQHAIHARSALTHNATDPQEMAPSVIARQHRSPMLEQAACSAHGPAASVEEFKRKRTLTKR